MNAQRHVIKRQLVELTIHGSADARQFQAELSRIYRQRIIPLIDQYCSEFSGPDQLYRIDKLDINLDALDPHKLEDDFVAKASVALRRELTAQINQREQIANQSGSSSRMQSQLELFSLFIRTGNLPWWADTSHRGLLAENLKYLLDGAPEALVHLLRELAGEPDQRQRMIAHYSDGQLTALCGLLVPNYQSALQRDFRDLLIGLQSINDTAASQSIRLRQRLWNNFLIVSSLGGQQYATLEAFYQAVLSRISMETGGTFNTLIADLHQAREAGRITVNSQMAELIARLVGIGQPLESPIPGSETLAAILAKLQFIGGPSSEVWSALGKSFPHFSSALQAGLLNVLEELPGNASEQIIAQRIVQVMQTESKPEIKGIAEGEIAQVLQTLRKAAGDFTARPESVSKVSATDQQLASDKKILDLDFSEADKLPIGNSGLVILWPFLSQFLARLGLVADRQFKDVAARHRTAGLLQYLATEETTFEEYFLPLNKVLCGIDMNEVFDFGLPMTDTELKECDNLLGAVIAQAPILRDMSAASFRGTFLLRQGMLSTRDGAWLLQVEHETYDIVLERFPWNWEWVKLPWMEAPLRVEW